MAGGPIISGGSPRMEALLFLGLVVFGCVLLSPQLTGEVLSKAPWLGPLFDLAKRALNSK